MRSIGRCSALLCLLALLGACGFALRSNDVLSAQFQQMQLNLAQPNSEFSRLLRRSLTVADVEASVEAPGTEAASNTLPVLQIGPEQVARRPVTVNPRARAAQYELRLSIEVALAVASRMVITPQELYVERIYFEDIENITGNQEEVAIIVAEMRRELVNQLMRRLEASGP